MKKTSQGGLFGPEASKKTYDGSSYLTHFPGLGQRHPVWGRGGEGRADTGYSYPVGIGVAGSCGVICKKSCTAEPQAEPGKGCEVSETLLEKASPAGKSLLSQAVALLSAILALVLWGSGDEVMWGCRSHNSLGCAKNFSGLLLPGGCQLCPSIS